ncbi:MAG: phosphoribosylglycinamide formyltransferase [Candidatus Omnitrophica bacterium]|nr:phosphoribosylglycinamide formyltransferase [Candidatus Omnitrophota bacterium]MCK5494020.1 phosphoribosylglycinamide formyltransferase [Candidatus Omnitrophota bacterium]
MNIAILASGNGSNFEALVKASNQKKIRSKIKLLITDKENAFVRERAKKNNIAEIFVDPNKFESRLDFDKYIIKILLNKKINLIILAGYMRILTPFFTKKFKNKILNIHPSILPSFKGTNSIARALDFGCKVFGVTVHFVNEHLDNGPIILQDSFAISQNTCLKSLAIKIHKLEHKSYPLAVKLIEDNKIEIKGRQIIFK